MNLIFFLLNLLVLNCFINGQQFLNNPLISNNQPLICPPKCVCYTQDKKQFINCANANYSSLPTIGLNHGSQVLKFDNNTLNYLPNRLFEENNLINLQHLFLSNCQLKSIAIDAFSQLSHLIELDLSYNQLNIFPSYALHHCTKLKRLQLSGNPIKIIKESDFNSISSNLTHLEISNAQLEHVEIIQSLKKLEFLDLSSNRLSDLVEDLFCPLTTLKSLNLASNSLTDFKFLGVVYHVTGHLCLQELQRLDLSHNKIVSLSGTGVASLKNLRELNLKNNLIKEINELSLSTLNDLTHIDLSNNKLTSIPSNTFKGSIELRVLELQNNFLNELPVGLFSGLSKLASLNLSHNAISEEHLNKETFVDLIRMAMLDLSYNQLKRIDSSIFLTQYKVKYFFLNNNKIEHIEGNTFTFFYNLETLVLSSNRIKHINDSMLNGSHALSKLYLNDNKIFEIRDNFFKNCSALQELYLQNNFLRSIPKAINVLNNLKILNLSNNNISKVQNSSLLNLLHLEEIDLSKNQITNLTMGSLANFINLKILDLSKNLISYLEYGVFHDAPSLKTIYLQNNKLTNINGQFMKLVYLQELNVSNNLITWFDYALIPEELITLDLSHNQIIIITNQSVKNCSVNLKYFDLSYNYINSLSQQLIPNSIRYLDVSHNKIQSIQQFTFVHKENITKVNLRNNLLTLLDMEALHINPKFHLLSITPEFYLANNPYSCDCSMEWLQRVNNMDRNSQHPRVVDLKEINCELPFVKQSSIVPLMQANNSNFLCKYKSHCYALCHCCDFDACDCEMLCPDNCTCYFDTTWNTNIVDCSAGGNHPYNKLNTNEYAINLNNANGNQISNLISTNLHSVIPTRIPMDVTELYLDGNNFVTLASHTFIGRKNMRSLYLNASNIHVISNKTFNGLSCLTVLHLENNFLKELNGFEFDGLTSLRELYLHHNQISIIHDRTFTNLSMLQILRLDYNLILDLPFFKFNYHNPKLNSLYLAENYWPCMCNVLIQMQSVLLKVKDANNLRCMLTDGRNLTTVTSPIIEYVTTTCNVNSKQFYNQQPNQQNAHQSYQDNRLPNANFPPSFDFEQILNNEIENKIYPNDVFSSQINSSNNNQYDRNLSIIKEHLPVFLLIVVVSVIVMFMILICIFRQDICIWAYSSFGIRLFQRSSNLGYPRYIERLYDAFVSFTNQEKDFVNTMVNTLEHGQPPYRLSMNFRDVPVTNYEKEAIQKFIESSHRTIIVLSPQYIRSENCMYELKIAYHNAIQSHGVHQLIIIEMDKQLNPNDYYIYDDLGAALNSPYTTRISFDEKRFWDKLKYAMPSARAQYDYRHSTLTMNTNTLQTSTNIYNNKFFASTINNNSTRNCMPYNSSICEYKRSLPTNV